MRLLPVTACGLVAYVLSACGSPLCTQTATCASFETGGGADGGSDGSSGARLDGSMSADGSLDGRGLSDAIYDSPFDSLVEPDGMVDSSCATGAGEDCSNGIDDNCNGLVDCADPLCMAAGYACEVPAPSGWSGPIELTQSATAPPTCAVPYGNDVVDGNLGLTANAAACTCSCGGVTNADCDGTASWTLYTDTSCANSCAAGSMPSGVATFCDGTDSCSAGSFRGVSYPAELNLASCNPIWTTTKPPSSWQTTARGCGYSGPGDMGGCSGGSMCMAKPSAPFGTELCVYQSGSVPCPSDTYTVQTVVYGGVDDTRTCTTCGCGPPSEVSCAVSGTLSVYPQGGQCIDSPIGSISDFSGDVCVVLGGAATGGVEGLLTVTPTGGSCTANGGQPTGSAAPSSPTTICCTP